MTDVLRNPKEFPDSGADPSRPQDYEQENGPAMGSYMPGTSGSTGAVRVYSNQTEHNPLHDGAVKVGNVVGRTVATARRGKGKLLVMKSRAQDAAVHPEEELSRRGEAVKSSARDVANKTRERASEFVNNLQERAIKFKSAAGQRASDLQLRL